MVASLLLGLTLSATSFDQMLVIGPFSSGGRTPCPTDPIAYQMVENTFRAPHVDDTLANRKWKSLKAGEDGWMSDGALNGGYAYACYDSPTARTMLLEASGHSMVYVNGVPRGGDPYAFGFVKLPVQIKKGVNELLFSVGRGRLTAKLTDLQSGVTVTQFDPTLPDIIVGEDGPLLCSVLVMNATDSEYRGKISGTVNGQKGDETAVVVSPMTVKKVAFSTAAIKVDSAGKVKLDVALDMGSKSSFDLDGKLPSDMHKRTYRTKIDGSVQYYAVQPALNPHAPGLVLSLHGASVEATSQAASYGRKSWCNIVCPTNGRPYGFDWEDWGRITGIEALEDAIKRYRPEPDRIYLTGHSMGGHGTWSVGFNHPNLFAAIAPCAGWISFWSYGGAADWKDPDAVEKSLRRAANGSDTLKLLTNAKSLGIFVQHGDADDNVPVEQAREMRKLLSEFHRDLDWHEEPGQSHWFDTDPEPGANVQDYAPLFDFLSRHRVPNADDKRLWDVTSVNPDGDRTAANVTMVSTEQAMTPSRLQVRTWADGTYEEITTTNVKVVELSPLFEGTPIKAKVDGLELVVDKPSMRFVREGTTWRAAREGEVFKTIPEEGGIKYRFGNGVKGCYGTQGSKDERVWAYNKARYDAETWWYRGNGSLDLVSDQATFSGSVVFYGNTRTNSALAKWAKSNRGPALPYGENAQTLKYGSEVLSGDLGLVWAGKGVGVIGGTTLKGCRAVERVPVFLSGAHFPEFYVNSPQMYLQGSKGVVAAGFYGFDWGVDTGNFSVRK